MPTAAMGLEQILPQNLQMESSPAHTTKSAWGSEQRSQPFWISDLQECKVLNGCCSKLLRFWYFLMQQQRTKTLSDWSDSHCWHLATHASIALYTILNHELGLSHFVIVL